MRELSIFVDESGEYGEESKYYLLTLVLHDQSVDITRPITIYEAALARHGLSDIPFHASPLMNGHEAYEDIPMSDRKKLLASFYIMVQNLPIQYHTFAYRKRDLSEKTKLPIRMRKDIVLFLYDNLSYFQSFDKIKTYYDGGQQIVSQALRNAVDFTLAKDAALFRNASPEDYRLAQAADFVCAIELAAIKYEYHDGTATDEKIFGGVGNFKRNYLKKIRRMRI